MPAKKKQPSKKTPTMTRGERAAMVIDRWATMELEVADLRKQLAAKELAADALLLITETSAATRTELAKVKETLDEAEALLMMEKAARQEHGRVVEGLTQELAASQTDLIGAGDYGEDLRQKLVAETRECDFWIDEAERFRNQVVELLREQAMQPKP